MTLPPGLGERRILITGGTRGLGRSMAHAFARAGARVAVTGVQNSPALRDASATLLALGAANARAIRSDVADAEACVAAAEAVVEDWGGIDVLVNNAGLGMRPISESFTLTPTQFWEADPDAWAQITATNVDGPFFMSRAVVPAMVARGYGKVINVSTSAQTMVRRGYAPYGPSKAFLEAASRIWAQDLAGTGVTVNVLLPGGATDTDLLPAMPGRRGADGNLLPVTVMDDAALWLASDDSDGITGARFIARRWPEGADRAARDDTGAPPRLL